MSMMMTLTDAIRVSSRCTGRALMVLGASSLLDMSVHVLIFLGHCEVATQELCTFEYVPVSGSKLARLGKSLRAVGLAQYGLQAF